MLVLTRKSGESISIGNDIRVTILGISGKQVKLGITAPERILVYREEIFKKIQSENIKASLSLKEDLQELEKIIKARKRKNGGEKQ